MILLVQHVIHTLPTGKMLKELVVLTLSKKGMTVDYNKYNQTENIFRQALPEFTGFSKSKILKMTKLTDLSRIKWVGTTFALMLYDMGYDTLLKITKADSIKLHKEINQFNKENGIYRGHIGLNDVRVFINAAKDLPLDIEF